MSARTSFLLALLFCAWPAAAAPESKPDVTAVIAAANQALAEAYARGDAAAIAGLYTQEAHILPPDGDFVRGREAVQAFWQKMMSSGIPELHRQSSEVKNEGALAYEVGRFRLGGKSGRLVGQGKYIVIWKRDGNTWKLHRDIWNGTPPPPER